MRRDLRPLSTADQTHDRTQLRNGATGMNTTIPTTLSAAGANASTHGKVWLIGAGPGDPELLTVKAARQLQRCTIWLVDDLVSQSILELASPKTRIIHVGKRRGCVSTSPQFILSLMTRSAHPCTADKTGKRA